MVRTTNPSSSCATAPTHGPQGALVVLQVLDYELRQLGKTRVHKLHEANLAAHWPGALERLHKVLGRVLLALTGVPKRLRSVRWACPGCARCT